MGALENVVVMQKQGLSEKQIIESLQQQGISYKDISEALAQSKIKAAIEEPNSELSPLSAQQQNTEMPEEPNYQAPQEQETAPVGMPGMQKSIMVPEESAETQEYFPIQPAQTQQAYDQNYPQYDYAPMLSSDTITEISEQIVSEKLSDVRKKMEKMLDFKTELEAKTESIEERLKRVEKIIDTLQASVLRKVGDYVTNVEDIKKELISTQETFTTIAPHLKKPEHKHHVQPQSNHHSPEHRHHEHKK